MIPHHKSMLTLTLALLLLLGTPGLGYSDTKAETEACPSKPYVVKIHADWCGACRSTQATWEKIEQDLAEQATAIKLDVTDRVAYEASEAKATQLGIETFFMKYRTQTGVIAVLDCNTREPIAVLPGVRDFEPYRVAVEKANSAG